MNRRQVRADDAAIERLRLRQATWDDRQDEALAGLLALARATDHVAPAATPVAAPRRTRRMPALAGVSTTAFAALALVFVGLGGGTGGVPSTTASPTLSSDAVAVTKLLAQVKADLAKAKTAPTAAKPALLARAASTLRVAEKRTQQVPSSNERADLTRTGDQLQRQLPPTASGRTAPPAHPRPAPTTGSSSQATSQPSTQASAPPANQPRPRPTPSGGATPPPEQQAPPGQQGGRPQQPGPPPNPGPHP